MAPSALSGTQRTKRTRVGFALRVEATYNAATGRFLALGGDVENTVGGVALSGDFTIEIRQRRDRTLSRLPALRVQDVEPVPERHFSQTDKTACLCSPFEEDEFLIPAFQFRRYFEELVVPFLYGQLFHSKHGYWPWSEYAHGATGLLESYARVRDPSKAKDCIEKLASDANWPNIRAVLAQRTRINGHVRCFCSKKDFMRRCHPAALKGLRMLRNDASAQGLSLPSILQIGRARPGSIYRGGPGPIGVPAGDNGVPPRPISGGGGIFDGSEGGPFTWISPPPGSGIENELPSSAVAAPGLGSASPALPGETA